MAAGSIPAPGTELGPCKTQCEHLDCAESRRQAALLCRFCGGPIGYETRFYLTGDPNPKLAQSAHAVCLEEAVENQDRVKESNR